MHPSYLGSMTCCCFQPISKNNTVFTLKLGSFRKYRPHQKQNPNKNSLKSPPQPRLFIFMHPEHTEDIAVLLLMVQKSCTSWYIKYSLLFTGFQSLVRCFARFSDVQNASAERWHVSRRRKQEIFRPLDGSIGGRSALGNRVYHS